jgi:hypothetical protein
MTSRYSQTVLESLHNHKSKYQRNMLIGLSVVFAMTFIPVTTVMINRLSKEESVIAELPIAYSVPSIPESGRGSAGHDDRPGSSRGMVLPYNHDGFAEVNGYKILRDDGSPRNKHRIHVKAADLEIESESDLGIVASDPGMGYGTSNEYASGYGDGLGDDFGLPDDQLSLIDVANSIFPSPGWPYGPNLRTKPDAPAFIQFIRPPRASRKLIGYQGEGYALVEFTIETDGWISDRVVLAQYPEGYGIADSLFAALDDAVVWPAKIAGDKVSVRYHFKWIFCIGSACGGAGLSYTSGPQIIVSGDAMRQSDKP